MKVLPLSYDRGQSLPLGFCSVRPRNTDHTTAAAPSIDSLRMSSLNLRKESRVNVVLHRSTSDSQRVASQHVTPFHHARAIQQQDKLARLLHASSDPSGRSLSTASTRSVLSAEDEMSVTSYSLHRKTKLPSLCDEAQQQTMSSGAVAISTPTMLVVLGLLPSMILLSTPILLLFAVLIVAMLPVSVFAPAILSVRSVWQTVPQWTTRLVSSVIRRRAAPFGALSRSPRHLITTASSLRHRNPGSYDSDAVKVARPRSLSSFVAHHHPASNNSTGSVAASAPGILMGDGSSMHRKLCGHDKDADVLESAIAPLAGLVILVCSPLLCLLAVPLLCGVPILIILILPVLVSFPLIFLLAVPLLALIACAAAIPLAWFLPWRSYKESFTRALRCVQATGEAVLPS